jgi:D-beta-D-heptose 7-phosphate kinase/D-beta-D-heptose 1-phosphate adenosyltransferase
MSDSVPFQTAALQRPRVAVVGDIMIDIDLHCVCTRLCQEGPWPVYHIQRLERRLGGAGNVARMVRALNAEALLAGLVGCEPDPFPDHDGLHCGWISVPGQTTTKTRLWVDGRLFGPRIDQDLNASLESSAALIDRVRDFAPAVIIIADHGKGAVTRALMIGLQRLDVPMLVDPVVTTPMVDGTVCVGGRHEQPACEHQPTGRILKLGADGLLWEIDDESGSLRSRCRHLVDPLGAGDQFIAALAVRRSLGDTWPAAITYANTAAGLQCERPGCDPVTELDVSDVSRLAAAS